MVCLITGTVTNAAGAAQAGAVLVFTPLPFTVTGRDGSTVTPEPVRTVASGAGAVSVSLLAGNYTVTVGTTAGTATCTAVVPDLTAAQLSEVISTPLTPYELIDWVAFQAAVAAAAWVWPDVPAGLAGSAEGELFFAVAGKSILLYRETGGVPIPVMIDVL